MTMGARIKALRKRKGMNARDLAATFHISPSAVSMWEHDETRPDQAKLQGLARVLGTTIEYLLHGTTRAGGKSAASDGAAVPLISWVAAGSWYSAQDIFEPGDADEWIDCPRAHSSLTYALRVRGDSMTSAHGKSYPDGCVIFVDPELRAPQPGDRIIAKLDGADEVTFKVFSSDAGRAFLRALNPQYPPIVAPFRVLGTVIGKWEED